jgi:hypothetical protein
MPADVNKTVSISYKADMKDLFSNLKKIPGMTEEEAKKMVKALDKQLKATEKAAQKASKGTTKAMNQITAATKKTSGAARTLRKDFANIDRLSSEASQALGLLSPEMGQAAAQVSVLASAMESLGRMFFISNPLFLAAAVAAGLVYFALDSQEAAAKKAKEETEKFNAALSESDKHSEKLVENLIKLEQTLGTFQTLLNDTTNEFNDMTGAIEDAALQEMKIFQQAQQQAVELTKAEEKIVDNFVKQREEKQKQIKLLDEELDRTRKTGARGKAYSKILEYRKELETAIEGKQLSILKINRQIQESEAKISSGFQDEADALEEILLQKKEQEEREKRIKEAQKRRNDRLKEFSKLLKETLKPLKEAEKLIAASTQAREKSIKSLQKQDSTRQKIAMTALKEELKEIEKRLKENEKNTNLSELQVTRENERLLIQQKQNTLKAIENLQIEGLRKKNEQVITQIEKQITEVHKRQNLERTILETARAELEAQKQIALQTKNKSERTEKIKQIEEAFLRLKTDEATFNESLKTDEQTLITLQESKVQAALNGYEQIQNAIKETGELEKETFLDIVNTIQESIGTRTSEILGNVQGIHDASQKLATAQIDLLQQQIDNVAAARDKHLERIDEAEKKGIITAEQAAKRKEDAEKRYAESVKDEQIRMFKTQQAAQIAQAIMDAASASARAFKDYPFPVSLGVAGLAAAAATMRVQQIKAQKPPQKFDMGGMIGSSTMSPDMGTIQALKGEAILDRATVNNIGGEQGIQALQNNSSNMGQVVVIQPFKHFDKFVRTASRNNMFGMKKSFSSKY